MKKITILMLAMLLTINAFAQAQITTIDRCLISYMDVTNIWGKVIDKKISSQTICLSNGDIIKYDGAFQCWYNPDIGDRYNAQCITTFVPGRNYASGTLVYKAGRNYEVIALQKRGTLTIKKTATHQVNSEFNASLKGDFSYHSFIVGNGSGSIRGSASGGTRTVVNVFFDNGTSATIDASKDPIWLDAEAGMKVEHHVYRNMNIYKLL